MVKKKAPVLLARLRTYKDSSMCSLWILELDGAASSCLLWGEMSAVRARALVESFGLALEEEASLLPFTPVGASTTAPREEPATPAVNEPQPRQMTIEDMLEKP
jgi:hypothetical protein